MSLINRRFNCTGLRIPLPGPWQLELWWCPRGAVIPMHRHPHVESVLVFLGGRMLWKRVEEYICQSMAGPYKFPLESSRRFGFGDVFRWFRVPANESHGATVIGRFGLFANLERWTGPKTSAAQDLELA